MVSKTPGIIPNVVREIQGITPNVVMESPGIISNVFRESPGITMVYGKTACRLYHQAQSDFRKLLQELTENSQ